MSFRHGKSTALFLDSLNASPFFNASDVSRQMATADVTTFGATAKAYIAGEEDATLSASGFYDGAIGQIGDKLNSLGGAGVAYPATLCQDGGCVIGRQAQLMDVDQTDATVSAPVGGAVTVKYSGQVTGGVDWGKILNDATQLSAIFPGTTVDWGANGASAAGGVMNIHVPFNTRSTTTVVKLQHSTDNATWVDLAGTSQTVPVGQAVDATHPFGAPSAYTLTIAGAVNRYLRAVVTPAAGTGAISAVVAFARF